MEKFNIGQFSVTENEKKHLSPEELAELEEKIRQANARKTADASEEVVKKASEHLTEELGEDEGG